MSHAETNADVGVTQILVRMLLLALGYAALAQVGTLIYNGPNSAAYFRPANSLVVVVLCFSPMRHWPWLLLASAVSEVLVDRYQGMSWLTGAGLALANSTESGLAAVLALKFTGNPVRLDSIRNLFAYLLLVVAICPAVSANLGAAVLFAAGLAPSFPGAWGVWWLGDALGLLLVFPALLALTEWRSSEVLSAARVLEALCLAGALAAALTLGFGGAAVSGVSMIISAYLVFPILVWAALRFGIGLAAWSSLAVGMVSVWHTAHGLGPFATNGGRDAALSTQAFLATATVTALALAASVAERKRAEAAVRSKQSFIQRLTDTVPVTIYVFNCQSGAAEFFTRKGAEILGYTPEEFMSLRTDPLSIMHTEDRPRFAALLKTMAQGADGASYEFECRMRHRNGEWRWFTSRNVALENSPDGRLLRLLGAATDITARKHAEEQLRKAHDEKQVLLREVYHRVKNNLQIVSALISLQAARIPEATAQRALAQGEARIRSMALVHEQLYRSDNLSTIEVDTYFGKLVGALADQLRYAKISIDCDPITLGMDQALPCGLILNELVSNAGQHAFAAGQVGEIEVRLRRMNADWLSMEVTDNGVGLPDDAELARRNSLGWLLVQSLTNQLDGTLSVRREHGTSVRIEFRQGLQQREVAA